MEIVELSDRATVWAFSDIHGVRSGLVAALREAGLADRRGRWCAEPGTVLVGCGDYIDRGADAPGVITLLRRLAQDAVAAGGGVVLARGNHEHLALEGLAGDDGRLHAWLFNGGYVTATSLGCPVSPAELCGDVRPLLERVRRTLGEEGGWFRGWLETLVDAVRWRDVLFVHGGLPSYRPLEAMGGREADHLWIRHAFFEEPRDPGDPRYVDYEEAGIDRVVFGHTTQAGPAVFHDGRSLCLDTNACGKNRKVPPENAAVTLARIPRRGSLAASVFVSVPTVGAPEHHGRLTRNEVAS